MKRGGSSGGGQSSLGYLFGSSDDHNKQKNSSGPPPPSPTTYLPPYGIDVDDEKPQGNPHTLDKAKASKDYIIRIQGQNSGNLVTGRPSTKVKSAPGGDSSLGYLFGDES